LGAGTAIGVSIFSVLQPAAQLAGSGLMIGIAIAGVPMVLFATIYSYLGSALPTSGASYDWPRLFIHPLAGFVVSWLRILSNVGAMTVLSLVLVKYASMAIMLPLKPSMAVAITLVFALNYFGVKLAAAAQTLLFGLLLAVLAALVVLGAPQMTAGNVGPLLTRGWLGIAASVPLLASLFLGIESAADIGEEIHNPQRNLPLGIALAIAVTAMVYGTIAYVALGLVGPAQLAGSEAPLLEAARVPFGHWAVPVIVGAATVSILKTMNASALVFTRCLFAMGRSGVLTRRLAEIHPRFRTPHIAVLTGYAAAMTGLLLPSTMMFLLLTVNLPTMLKYLACSVSAVRVAARHPEIHLRSRLQLSRKAVRWLGGAAAICAVAVGGLGASADWRPYALVSAWLVVGLIYWAWRRRHDTDYAADVMVVPAREASP